MLRRAARIGAKTVGATTVVSGAKYARDFLLSNDTAAYKPVKLASTVRAAPASKDCKGKKGKATRTPLKL